MPRQSVNRMNTGTRKNEGENTYKIDGGVYENTTEIEAVPNNRQFPKLKSGTVFKINRPAFKYNLQKVANEQVPMYVSKRTGTGNYNIRRSNFKAEPIRPRNLGFEKMELQTLRNAGQEIAIGDETLDKLFAVQVKDPSDGEWLLEVQRRKDAGETDAEIAANPPFRREQRTITKNINFATTGLKLEDKIELLQTAVMSNSVESQKELKEVATSIAMILKDVEQLNQNQTKVMGEIVNRLNLPVDPFEAGLPQRIYSLSEYQKDAGLVNFYIYSRAFKMGLNLNSPVEGMTGNLIKLSSLGTYLSQGKGDVFFDAVDMKLVPRAVADLYRPTLVDEGKQEEEDEDGLAPTEVMGDEGDTGSLATTEIGSVVGDPR